ncbi:hypothetical protein FACS1894120_3040 [Clostridia bacterium]|nr:hypothetical protein FACS1894120_3040 [Clostridia bacterium]
MKYGGSRTEKYGDSKPERKFAGAFGDSGSIAGAKSAAPEGRPVYMGDTTEFSTVRENRKVSERINKVNLTMWIVWALVVAFFALYVIVRTALRATDPFATETALYYKIPESLLFTGVYVRDEFAVREGVAGADGLNVMSSGGVLAYTHKNGSKLQQNTAVAKVYATKDDIEREKRIAMLKKQVEVLQDADRFVGSDSSQTENFRSQLTDVHSRMLRSISEQNFEQASELLTGFLDGESKLAVVDGTVPAGYYERIDALMAEIKTLEANIGAPPRTITAGDASGYFVGRVDGYEDVLKYDEAVNLTAAEIDNVIRHPVSENINSRGVVGKMMSSYRWRLAAVLDKGSENLAYAGEYVTLLVGHTGEPVRAKVLRVTQDKKSGKEVFIFECDRLNGESAEKRTNQFRLVLDNYTGIRISRSALRFVTDPETNESVKGVYVLQGGEVEFKKIEVLISKDDYVLVADTTKDDGFISLYDEIIVRGEDLYDGKAVSRFDA